MLPWRRSSSHTDCVIAISSTSGMRTKSLTTITVRRLYFSAHTPPIGAAMIIGSSVATEIRPINDVLPWVSCET
jgi:hypothetical protein